MSIKKTHCKRGHNLSVFAKPRSDGQRYCGECHKEQGSIACKKQSIKDTRAEYQKEHREQCREYSKKHYHENGGKKTSRMKHIKSKYGLLYDPVPEQPECGICHTTDFKKRGPMIDHNHETGKFRGILCNHCNVGLGFLNTKEKLSNAIKYLQDND